MRGSRSCMSAAFGQGLSGEVPRTSCALHPHIAEAGSALRAVSIESAEGEPFTTVVLVCCGRPIGQIRLRNSRG